MKSTEPFKRLSGYTLTEILAVLTIISIMATLSTPPLQAFIQRLRFQDCLRQVSQLIRQGQTLSRELHLPCRLIQDQDEVILQKKNDHEWQSSRFFYQPAPGIHIRFNQNPIFYPSGAIVPLCTVTITQGKRRYSLTLSAAGRVRSKRLS